MSALKVHSLNCGIGDPLGIRLFPRRFQGHMVTHVLLIEHGDRLTLVDSGLSAHELEDPRRLGSFSRALRFRAEPERAAIQQIRDLGFDPSQVTDIVLTHLDLDHAGGLVDFPEAKVHVHPAELAAARARRSWGEKVRYRPEQWERAKFVEKTIESLELLPGVEALPLDGVADGSMALVPLPGHTRGHSAVWIGSTTPAILFTGDAYYDHSERTMSSSLFFECFRKSVHVKPKIAAESLLRLDAIEAAKPGLRVIGTHDPSDFAGGSQAE